MVWRSFLNGVVLGAKHWQALDYLSRFMHLAAQLLFMASQLSI